MVIYVHVLTTPTLITLFIAVIELSPLLPSKYKEKVTDKIRVE